LTEATGDLTKEADLLAGDAISNFKTVQSFANEELIIQLYERFYEPVITTTVKESMKVGIGFGMSQLF